MISRGIKINLTSTVSDKGLTTIPKEIRKKLNIKKGDKVYWILNETDKTELFLVRDPVKYLTGRYSQEGLTYENLEHKADDLILSKVKKESL